MAIFATASQFAQTPSGAKLRCACHRHRDARLRPPRPLSRGVDPFRIGLTYQELEEVVVGDGGHRRAARAVGREPAAAHHVRRVRAVGVPGDRLADAAVVVARRRATRRLQRRRPRVAGSPAPRGRSPTPAPTLARARRPPRTAAGRPPARRRSAGHPPSSSARRRRRPTTGHRARRPSPLAEQARLARPRHAARAVDCRPRGGVGSARRMARARARPRRPPPPRRADARARDGSDKPALARDALARRPTSPLLAASHARPLRRRRRARRGRHRRRPRSRQAAVLAARGGARLCVVRLAALRGAHEDRRRPPPRRSPPSWTSTARDGGSGAPTTATSRRESTRRRRTALAHSERAPPAHRPRWWRLRSGGGAFGGRALHVRFSCRGSTLDASDGDRGALASHDRVRKGDEETTGAVAAVGVGRDCRCRRRHDGDPLPGAVRRALRDERRRPLRPSAYSARRVALGAVLAGPSHYEARRGRCGPRSRWSRRRRRRPCRRTARRARSSRSQFNRSPTKRASRSVETRCRWRSGARAAVDAERADVDAERAVAAANDGGARHPPLLPLRRRRLRRARVADGAVRAARPQGPPSNCERASTAR